MSVILTDVKKVVGGSTDDDSFDIDLIIFINTTLGVLYQLGLEEAGLTPVIDETTTWDELLGGRKDLEIVKSYIILKVRLMFDPPTNSSVMESIKQTIGELEWRINNIRTITSIN